MSILDLQTILRNISKFTKWGMLFWMALVYNPSWIACWKLTRNVTFSLTYEMFNLNGDLINTMQLLLYTVVLNNILKFTFVRDSGGRKAKNWLIFIPHSNMKYWKIFGKFFQTDVLTLTASYKNPLTILQMFKTVDYFIILHYLHKFLLKRNQGEFQIWRKHIMNISCKNWISPPPLPSSYREKFHFCNWSYDNKSNDATSKMTWSPTKFSSRQCFFQACYTIVILLASSTNDCFVSCDQSQWVTSSIMRHLWNCLIMADTFNEDECPLICVESFHPN